MYALAINGSPRSDGNTQYLLNQVLMQLSRANWQTEIVQVGGAPIRGCMACLKCKEIKNQRCSINTDHFNEIMEKMIRADALILGSPTYFADVSSEMKALIDRSGYVALANNRAFKAKIGAAVVAVRRGGSIHAFDTINHLFMINQMIVPGSSYWNMGLGRERGEVQNDSEGIRNMINLGQTIAWLGHAISQNKDNFPKLE